MRPFPVVVTIAVLLAASRAAPAAPVETDGATACAIAGWSADTDPAGLNVRTAPRKDAYVIARLPAPIEQPSDAYAVEFSIIGSKDGWFLIRDSRVRDYGDDKGDRKFFVGPGWVFADKVRFEINTPELRRSPDPNAPVVGLLRTPDFVLGPDSATIDHVHGCAGDFAEVTAHMDHGKQIRGWATRICSNQVTTCN